MNSMSWRPTRFDDSSYAQQVFELRYRTIPELQKRISHDTGNKFLTDAIMAVFPILARSYPCQ